MAQQTSVLLVINEIWLPLLIIDMATLFHLSCRVISWHDRAELKRTRSVAFSNDVQHKRVLFGVADHLQNVG